MSSQGAVVAASLSPPGGCAPKESGSMFITPARTRECGCAVSVPGSLRNVSGQRTRLRASLEQQRGSAMR